MCDSAWRVWLPCHQTGGGAGIAECRLHYHLCKENVLKINNTNKYRTENRNRAETENYRSIQYTPDQAKNELKKSNGYPVSS